MSNRHLAAATLAASLMLSGAAIACPAGSTMTIVVPYPPGTTDNVARLIMQNLGYASAIVENKSGADGSIGASSIARAAPNGCSVTLASSGTIVGFPAMHISSEYQSTDFTALGEVGQYTMLLYVNPRTIPGVRTAAQLAAYAKEHPGKLNWGRPTSTARIALAQFMWLTAKAKESDKEKLIVGVPYRGEAQAVQALIAGEIDVLVATSAVGYQHVINGSILALATTGSTRSHVYPDLPTMREAGITGWSPAELTAGFYGPKGMNPADVADFSGRLQKILEMPSVRDHLEKMGFEVAYKSPHEHAERVRQQAETWRRVIEYSGITREK